MVHFEIVTVYIANYWRTIRLRNYAGGWFARSSREFVTNRVYPHDDVIKWKHFPRHWPFVRGIHQSYRWVPLTKASDAEFWCFFDRHHDCLLNRLFRCRSKNTSKLRVTGLCEGNSPVTGEFSTQRVSNVENVSIWWRHHVNTPYIEDLSPYLILNVCIAARESRALERCRILWSLPCEFLTQMQLVAFGPQTTVMLHTYDRRTYFVKNVQNYVPGE